MISVSCRIDVLGTIAHHDLAIEVLEETKPPSPGDVEHLTKTFDKKEARSGIQSSMKKKN